VEDDEGHRIDNINENEDIVEEGDDYPSINMNDFLEYFNCIKYL